MIHGEHEEFLPEKMNLLPTPSIPPKGAFSITSPTSSTPGIMERQTEAYLRNGVLQEPAEKATQKVLQAIIREHSPTKNVPPSSPLLTRSSKRVDQDLRLEGGSHIMYPHHNKQSPKRTMKKIEPRSFKSPSSKSKKNYRNAFLLPKSKEPKGFFSSSHRFGPKAAYEPPETKDYFEKTNLSYKKSPRGQVSNNGVRRPEDERDGDMTLTLFEERQDPDRHNLPVRTAQTVSTAKKYRQHRHPRIMEQELIKYEKQNALLMEALREARQEAIIANEKLSQTETKLSRSTEKVNTLLILVKDILNRWVQKESDFDYDGLKGIDEILNKSNEKIFEVEDEDLVASSQNIIESYVEDSSSINTKIDEQLKSIEALLEEK